MLLKSFNLFLKIPPLDLKILLEFQEKKHKKKVFKSFKNTATLLLIKGKMANKTSPKSPSLRFVCQSSDGFMNT